MLFFYLAENKRLRRKWEFIRLANFGGSDGYHDTWWTFIPMPLGVLIAVAVG
jgi:hypothetical protein